MVLYQNRFPELPGVYKSGCLFIELVNGIQDVYHYEFNRDEVKGLYFLLNEQMALGSERGGPGENGAYVWNHEKVLNEAAKLAGDYTSPWRIYAWIYKDKQDFILDTDYKLDSEILILQIQTVNGGHFRGLNHDPWEPGTQVKYIKSERYYGRKK
jgi:hypothetical protein